MGVLYDADLLDVVFVRAISPTETNANTNNTP
jgi:hypothetical protein